MALQRLGGTRVAFFACPDTASFSARCQNREEHSPLAKNTAEFVHALVLLAAGLALCYGESINLINLSCFSYNTIQVSYGFCLMLVVSFRRAEEKENKTKEKDKNK